MEEEVTKPPHWDPRGKAVRVFLDVLFTTKALHILPLLIDI